ncbi:uncharacterized protein LOC116306997 [Actinia tenebrosa]|uniref:Uncharacterized protein LOC116306997 n=1 Tax=Actinia tenebrosa TaxID=6105 RepID=A0A6P8J0L5_ACTTE|nr:uncharacterized protein LOC116306997 [Actinia tenebrosa]
MFRLLTTHNLVHLFAMVFFVWGLDEKLMSEKYRKNEGVPISLEGYRLDGFQFQEIASTSFIRCGLACLAKTQKCVSYNFYERLEGLGRCELNSAGIHSIQEGVAQSLEKSQNTVYVQTRVQSMKYAESCSDHYESGARESGLYYIRDTNDHVYPVFCDFNTEANKAWTLFMSQNFLNRNMPAFVTKSLNVNYPVNEDQPNWDAYRLSFARMESLKRHSSHWRITCNMPRDGVSFVDYVRAKISNFDILQFNGKGACKLVEYMNVMGHECNDCTSAWWQFDGQIFHHDMTQAKCVFGDTEGATDSQDVFGFYQNVNSNFRCLSSNDSNTNYWFGNNV